MKGLEDHENCLNCKTACLFNMIEDDQQSFIDENKTILEFKKDEPIIRQGGFVSQVLFIRKGVVKKILEGKNNRNTILKVVEENNHVALPAFTSYKQYPFSVIAVTDCEVCLIRSDTLRSILTENQTVAEYLINWFTEDYLNLYKKIEVISTRNSHGRIATALLYLGSEDFKYNLLDTLARKDLAELAATSLESTNKIIQQLKHDGIIDIVKNEIIITRRDLLEKLSTVG